MIDLKWRPYPETLPPLPIDEIKEEDKVLVTILYDDGHRKVDFDYIQADGTWTRYAGTKRHKVIGWMHCPNPYVKEPEQKKLF